MSERDYDGDARKMGWVPQEEWKGDPEKWRPAQEFVERGENIVPILKDRLDKVEQELAATIKINKQQVEQAEQAAYSKAKAKYDQRIKELNQKEVAAVEEGDTAEYLKVKQEKDNLTPPEQPKVQPGDQQAISPVFEDWHKKNNWYEKDQQATRYAMAFGAELRNNNPGMSEHEFLSAIEKEVKETFPAKFTNPNREKAPAVEGGGNAPPPKSGGKGWSDLPDSAKATFNRLAKKFAATGKKLEKDQYAQSYFEE